jgi:hypothetical protein
MHDKETIETIERMHNLNPQYLKLGCLYDNRLTKTCEECINSDRVCKEMLRAFKYSPYEHNN